MFSVRMIIVTYLAKIHCLKITSSNELEIKHSEHTFVYDIELPGDFIFIEDDSRKFKISTDKKEALEPTLEAIMKYRQPPSELQGIANDLENLDKNEIVDENVLLRQGNTSFVVFFTDNLSQFSAAETTKYTNTLKVYLSDDKGLADEMNVTFPGVYGYNSHDRVTYNLPFTSVTRECAIVLTPVLKELTVETLKMYDDTGLPKFFLFYAEDEATSFYQQEGEYTNVVKKYRDVLKLGLLAYKKEKPTLQHFGIKEELLPCVVCVHDLKKYRLVNITPESLDKGLEEFKYGRLHAYEASGPEPENNDKLPVKVLTRTNYTKYFWMNSAEKTETNDQDAFIVFTSPHCRFCTELKPILSKFAEKKLPNLIVGDVDMTVNDFPEFEVKGYPTICFVTQGNIFYFNGSRTVEEFEKFVEMNSMYKGEAKDEAVYEDSLEKDNEAGESEEVRSEL